MRTKRYSAISNRNFEDASLKAWQNHMKQIYGGKNEKASLEEIWNRVSENLSKVAENLRRDKYGQALQSLTHVACWVLGFVNRAAKDMENIIWSKYPFICPYCTVEKGNSVKPCSCGTERLHLEEALPHKKEQMIKEGILQHYKEAFKLGRPKRLNDWSAMFNELYGNVLYQMPLNHVGLHLMEEVGEVNRVLRRRREFEQRLLEGKEASTDVQMARRQFELDLDSELADTFSWICSMANKIQSLASALKDFGEHLKHMESVEVSIVVGNETRKNFRLQVPQVTFSRILFWEYGDGCPNCGGIPCDDGCFGMECKFMIKDSKCGFDWTGYTKCYYGKRHSQSSSCGGRKRRPRMVTL